jgi:hypothetical protein
MKERELSSILDTAIISYDLILLKCSNYNEANAIEKAFLGVFLASIAH